MDESQRSLILYYKTGCVFAFIAFNVNSPVPIVVFTALPHWNATPWERDMTIVIVSPITILIKIRLRHDIATRNMIPARLRWTLFKVPRVPPDLPHAEWIFSPLLPLWFFQLESVLY